MTSDYYPSRVHHTPITEQAVSVSPSMLGYAVVIVNYNTAEHTQAAIRSVIACATSDDYKIMVVDNNSNIVPDVAGYQDRVTLLKSDSNLGFARGNNLGIKHAVDSWATEFIVIMNPDVQLNTTGTIERLIDRVRKSSVGIAGAQPLVRNSRRSTDPTRDVQVRQVPTVLDLIIAGTLILRYIFRERFRKFSMQHLTPYKGLIEFLVPSGAFFVIRTADFRALGYFDEGTFLYGEEFILGEKLRRAGKLMVLDANEMVLHDQGASTRFGGWHPPNGTMHKHRVESEVYFARKYLRATRFEINLLRLSLEVGYGVRFASWLFYNLRVRISTLWGK